MRGSTNENGSCLALVAVQLVVSKRVPRIHVAVGEERMLRHNVAAAVERVERLNVGRQAVDVEDLRALVHE
jgi:hypothetical protein